MTSPPAGVTFRSADAPDGAAIAALHTASWRAHYRGSLSDAYLDGPIEEERRAAWAERLTSPSSGQIVVLALDRDDLVGFVCAFVDADPVWGTLIDNLHVALPRKGGGIGRALLGEVGRRIGAQAPGGPVHLFVKAANIGARAFYERVGGRSVEEATHVGPDGSRSAVFRIVWPSPDALVEAARRPGA